MKAKKIIISILFLIIFICIGNCVYATTIEFSNDFPKVGDSIKITVTVSDVHTAAVFADVSGAGISEQIKVIGADIFGNKTTLSNSITVTPTSAGTITVSITNSSNAVADGQYVNVAASRTITVSESTSIVTQIGDVNGDRKITLADYTRILAHVKKTQLLTGDALKTADVNQDGKVTLADYTKVLVHVKKITLLQ